MKQSPEYSKAQQNMMPGIITAEGFLGTDTRTISDIIVHDEELMTKNALSFETLIDKLHYLMDLGAKGLGEPITIDSTWIVRVDEARGSLPSPFEHDGIYHKLNVEVKRIDNSKSILYSDLSLHLIEKYHFFQGRGSAFRIEPQQAKDVLGL